MILGKIGLNISYVVDLDNREMVKSASSAVYDDIMSAVKYDELHIWIGEVDSEEELTEDMIPTFLLNEGDYDE